MRVRRKHHWTTARRDVLECAHVDCGLEYDEDVGIIVRVNLLVLVAQVLGAIRAPVPLAADALHAPIARDRRVQQISQVVCGRMRWYRAKKGVHAQFGLLGSAFPKPGPAGVL
jgi:hypothetical protein